MKVVGNSRKPSQLSDVAVADREWERQCGDLARLASGWLWEMDSDLRITYVSDRLRWIMDVDPAFFIEKPREDYVASSTDSAKLEAHLADLRAHRPIREFIYDVETPSGRRYVKIDGDPLFDEDGNFLGYRGVGAQVTGQVKAQQKAEKSFQQLVDAVESLPVGLAQYDSNDKLLFWNGAYARLYPWLVPVLDYGVSFEQVIRHLADAGAFSASIKEREAWVEANMTARKSGRKPFEVGLSNGRWTRVSYHRTQSGGTISIHSDITRLKQEEDALRQSEQRFLRAFQFSPGATAIAEIDDGALIDVNEKWQETFGWTREEVIGKSVQDLGIWADRSDRRRFIEMLRADGRVRNFETRQCGREGDIRDMLVSGETVPLDGKPRLLITGHDITERKRAERELRDSEARLSGILRISPEAVIVTDGSQHITLFSDGAERTFGYTAADILGKSIDVLMPPDAREVHREHVRKFLRSPHASRLMNARQEVRAQAKDGTMFPVEASVSKLQLDGETVFTVLLRDITERKQAQNLLLAAKEEAESASRAKSEFLANMSHELRTPLNAILGFSEVIRNQVLGVVGVEKYVEYADDIHRSGEHLLEIIGDILDVARIDSGQIKLDEDSVPVDELIESSRVLIQERAEANGLEIAVSLPPETQILFCDSRKMKQILINLLSNAVKFTGCGGSISIGARIDEPTGDIVFQVRDNGIGMSVEDVPRVMEPFVQIESSLTRHHEGTGLGLPLVKKLTELHGGSLELETAPGKGTVAYVSLPAYRVIPGGDQRPLVNGGE
ncbi:MAG: PAS domain S-box protein [Proteobacteria bacterium]|nr:PAS domain S-box protein [Pseudomonadota bacterium]